MNVYQSYDNGISCDNVIFSSRAYIIIYDILGGEGGAAKVYYFCPVHIFVLMRYL